jgi:hypothetical protein
MTERVDEPETPEQRVKRRGARTKQMNIRFDVELWARLEHHAPLERRTIANLLQKLIADGLDLLDDAAAIREVIRNNQRLLLQLPPGEARRILERQQVIVERTRGGPTQKRLPPLPPSMRGRKKSRRKPRRKRRG